MVTFCDRSSQFGACVCASIQSFDVICHLAWENKSRLTPRGSGALGEKILQPTYWLAFGVDLLHVVSSWYWPWTSVFVRLS